MLSLLFALGVCASLGAHAGTGAADDRAEEDARGILAAAFQNRYDISFTAEIELAIQLRGDDARRRVLRVATLHEGGSYRAMGQLTFPHYLRGMTILSISEENEAHQAFVYLPSQSRVRRISLSHRDDAFLGSDLTYEDFERRRIEDYEVSISQPTQVQGEEVHVIVCKPVAKLNYEKSELLIAKSDFAILEIREYRTGSDTWARRMTAPRTAMQLLEGHVLATQMRFETASRKTATLVTFADLRAKDVDPRLFTASALARDLDLVNATK